MEEILPMFLGLLIIGFILTVPVIIYDNWNEREDCRLMESQGFQTKIMTRNIVMQECYVKDEQLNKFVPYEKFRAIGVD